MTPCFLRVAPLSAFGPELLEQLTPAEAARAGRFMQEDDRRRFALGRHLARHLAAAVSGDDPAGVAIRLRCLRCGSTEHGQPSAACPSGTVPLSISHAGGTVLVAATEGPAVGADVEQLDRPRFDPALFDQIESAAEAGRGPRDRAAFIRLWTLKEAVLKCTGDGLAVSPRSFAVDLSSEPPRVWGGSGRLAEPMALRVVDPGPGYMAAVAVAVPGPVRVVER